MVKDSAAHCNAGFFSPVLVDLVILVSCLGLYMVAFGFVWFCWLWLPGVFLLGRQQHNP
jgi:hypothetical protein